MPDRGCLALHRVCDSVIPSTTILLPCSHTLCDQCRAGSVDKDGGSVCPLDGEPIREDECQKLQLPQRKKQKLKAHCWNEVHGCDFVGPLAALLGHFEAECAFHTSPCQRCGDNVPNAKLAAHYIDGCSTNNFSSATLVESSIRVEAAASSSATGDVTATAQGIEGKAEYRYEDEIPALQSQVNELTEAARTQGAQLQELNATLALSLQTLNASVVAAAAKFSDAIGEASQLHQRILASREEESSPAHEAEATASASCSGAKPPRRKEATDILQNMEVLTAQSLWCLERLLKAHSTPANLPAARSSMVSQSREKRTSFRESTCTLRCANANEIVYLVVISDANELDRCNNATITSRLRHRNAWCRVTFGILGNNEGKRGWGLRLDWGNTCTCAESSCLPHAVGVTETGQLPFTFFYFKREDAECDARTQVFYCNVSMKDRCNRNLRFEIVIHDCE
ncbi:uncharacterized protein LOC142557317 isoform X2 [Dermacentor variabilis]|uniref:uncharacterized protein LOC142557317 isoform X2 n=1 Tax=Dermacentor variabilis TaxID=34621 RepID=UPI003F5C5DFA